MSKTVFVSRPILTIKCKACKFLDKPIEVGECLYGGYYYDELGRYIDCNMVTNTQDKCGWNCPLSKGDDNGSGAVYTPR